MVVFFFSLFPLFFPLSFRSSIVFSVQLPFPPFLTSFYTSFSPSCLFPFPSFINFLLLFFIPSYFSLSLLCCFSCRPFHSSFHSTFYSSFPSSFSFLFFPRVYFYPSGLSPPFLPPSVLSSSFFHRTILPLFTLDLRLPPPPPLSSITFETDWMLQTNYTLI